MHCPQCGIDLPKKMRFCIKCSFDFSTLQGFFDTPQLPEGFVLMKKYRIRSYVASGGMAYIYRVEDLKLGKIYALKEMMNYYRKPEDRENAVRRFSREAEILSSLRHPSIPGIKDHFSENNRHYLIMDFIEGKNLETMLDEHPSGRFDQSQIMEWLWRLIDVFRYLHGINPPVVYRDLKPSNVVITEDSRLFLIDFGIARVFIPQVQGTLIGTPGFAPPEQYKGQVDARSDVYSLGASLHHLLSGRDPRKEIPFSFPDIAELVPDIDPVLRDIIGGCLNYDVDKRIQSMDDVASMLTGSSMVSDSCRWFNEGIALAKKNENDKALEAFTRCIAMDPENYWAYLERGRIRYHLEEYEASLEDYMVVTRKKPELEEVYYPLALTLIKMGDLGAAEDMLQRALDKDPAHHPSYYQLGEIYTQQRDFDRAIEMYENALESNPSFSPAVKGIEQARRKKILEERIRRFDQTSTDELDPLRVYYNLGMYFMEWEKFDEAEAEFKKALRLIPDDPELHQGLGQLYNLTGDFEKAAGHFGQALIRKPDDYQLYLSAARSYVDGGMKKAAMEFYKLGIERMINSDIAWEMEPVFHSLLGEIIELIKDKKQAPAGVEKLMQALKNQEDPGDLFFDFWNEIKKIRIK